MPGSPDGFRDSVRSALLRSAHGVAVGNRRYRRESIFAVGFEAVGQQDRCALNSVNIGIIFQKSCQRFRRSFSSLRIRSPAHEDNPSVLMK